MASLPIFFGWEICAFENDKKNISVHVHEDRIMMTDGAIQPILAADTYSPMTSSFNRMVRPVGAVNLPDFPSRWRIIHSDTPTLALLAPPNKETYSYIVFRYALSVNKQDIPNSTIEATLTLHINNSGQVAALWGDGLFVYRYLQMGTAND